MILLPLLSLFAPPDLSRLVELARRAVVAEVRHQAPPPESASETTRPVFVTLEVDGAIRGCRGSLVGRALTLDGEVISSARAAAAHDPRYRPLSAAELSKFRVTVTVVSRLEPVKEPLAVGPEDGLVLVSGTRTGIVLPWEGKDPATRLRWAYRKAGVPEGSAAAFQRLVGERARG